MRLMVPPAGRVAPSNRITTRWPVALTQACSEQLDLQRVLLLFVIAPQHAVAVGIDALAPVHGQLVVRIAAADRPLHVHFQQGAVHGARVIRRQLLDHRAQRLLRLAGAGGLVAAGDVGQHGGRLLAGGVLALGDAAAQLGGGLVGRSARAGRRRGRIGAALARRRAARRRAATEAPVARLRVASAVSDSVDGVVLSVMVMVLAARGGPRAANSRPRPARKNGNLTRSPPGLFDPDQCL